MAVAQPIIFKKNKADFEIDHVTVTVDPSAQDPDGLARSILDRSSRTAWVTESSNDAETITIVVDMVDTRYFSDIVILGTNIKAYTLKYWDAGGGAWADFSTPISVTDHAEDWIHHNFTQVLSSKVQLVITGTQVADSDKVIRRFEILERIGQFEGWPMFKRVRIDRQDKATLMLNNKYFIVDGPPSYSCALEVDNWNIAADVAIVESMYNRGEGFYIWPCGGNEDQFSMDVEGYRPEDLYLVRTRGPFRADRVKGWYRAGLKVNVPLVEVTT